MFLCFLATPELQMNAYRRFLTDSRASQASLPFYWYSRSSVYRYLIDNKSEPFQCV